MTTAYERSLEFSEGKLDKIRSRLEELPLGGAVVLVCGSFARREASAHSDVDYAIVPEGTETDPDLSERVGSEIRSIVPNRPSEGGAFGGPVDRSKILANIGGDDDSNRNITHRILLLLEGEWLFNKEGLRGFRREILGRYIGDGMTDHQLALRKHLVDLDRSNRVDERFREIKNEGHHFTRELLKLFESTFDSTHPIRRAVVF